MTEALRTKRLSIVPTMKCTLNCKLCSNHIPAFNNPKSASYDEMVMDIDILFQLFVKIDWLQFVGGEIFLNRDFFNVCLYCKKYKSKFDKIVLETNATVTINREELLILADYGLNVCVMISDYGILSSKKDEYVSKFNEYNIPYILKKYHGDNQHFGGWVDNTGLCDYNESEEEISRLSAGCAQVKLENMHCYKGKLHRCSNSLFMTELGLFEPNERDYLYLHNNMLSLDDKRSVISDFYKKARMSCRYCTWKNTDTAARFSAAEQIEKH